MLKGIFIILFVSCSYTNAENVSAGVVVGSLTGLSAKFELGQNKAINLAIATSVDSKYGTSVHMDYLFENVRQIKINMGSSLDFYYGLGAKIENIRTGTDRDKNRLGIRGPFGLNYSINNPNLDFFGEVAPVLDLSPRSDVYAELGFGIRYRF